MSSSFKGTFKPKNYKKYKGNPCNIIFRSGWEFSFMKFLDDNDSVLEWNSEEIVIAYRNPSSNTVRRYFPDFWMKTKAKDGKIEEFIVEVKPLHETIAPQKTEKKTHQRYLKEVVTYTTNMAKWKAAKIYCEKKNMKFVVVSKNKKEQFMLLETHQLGIE